MAPPPSDDSLSSDQGAAEERLQALGFVHAPGGMAIVSPAGRILAANPAWGEMLGFEPASLVHRLLVDLAPGLRLITREDTGGPVDVELCHRSGKRVPATFQAAWHGDAAAGQGFFVCQIAGIAENKRAADALQSLTRGTAAATGTKFFQSLVTQLAAVLQVHTAFITQCLEPDPDRVRTLAYLQQSTICPNFEYDLHGTPCRHVIDGAPFYFPDQLEASFPQETGFASYLGVPIVDSEQHVIGHLAIMDDGPMVHGETDQSILEIFAQRAAAELERQRAEEELRRLYARIEASNRVLERRVEERTREIERRRQVAEGLTEIVAILNSSHSLPDILAHIAAQAMHLLMASAASLFRWDGQQEVLVLESAAGLPPELDDALTLPLDQNLGGQILYGREPLVISDIAGTLSRLNILPEARQQMGSRHFHTLLVTPITGRRAEEPSQAGYGALVLYYPESHFISEEDKTLALTVCEQASLAIENARLREQAEQTAVMAERSRLARELHDAVSQSLYSLSVMTEGWRRQARRGLLDAGGIVEVMGEVNEIAQQALKEMRLLVYQLRPLDLDQNTLAGAVRQRLQAVEERAGIRTELRVEGVGELPAAVEEPLYRVIQEALNNVLKHARAGTIVVQLRQDGAGLELEITDDGIGFDPAAADTRGGLGLLSMRERVDRLGGRLQVSSSPGEGTTITARLGVPETAPRKE